MVEQAHEIQCFIKDLELVKCVFPDKFFVGCIIAKLSPSWRHFATSMKHKRQYIFVVNLIGSLDIEKNTREKDTHPNANEARSSANMVQQGNQKFKGKNKATQPTNFKKKKNKNIFPCFVCGEGCHWAKDCKRHKERKP